MIGKTALLITAIAVYQVSAAPARASTNCSQTFTFLARTKGSNPVFWIAEDLDGQCSRSRLLQVAVAGSKASLFSADLKRQKDWSWLKERVNRFMTEEALELTGRNGVWKSSRAGWSVSPPAADANLAAEFQEHIRRGGSNARTWNKARKTGGAIMPVVNRIKVAPVYYYSDGLYFNYEISRACYFPKSGYILIFTRQKIHAVGLDTMHGFILLRRSG